MIKNINNILQDTLKTDVDYFDLAKDLFNLIKNNDREYNYLIDTIQVLIMREAYRFMTFIEVEELYRKIKGVI
jgi:hypothetical protein